MLEAFNIKVDPRVAHEQFMQRWRLANTIDVYQYHSPRSIESSVATETPSAARESEKISQKLPEKVQVRSFVKARQLYI